MQWASRMLFCVALLSLVGCAQRPVEHADSWSSGSEASEASEVSEVFVAPMYERCADSLLRIDVSHSPPRIATRGLVVWPTAQSSERAWTPVESIARITSDEGLHTLYTRNDNELPGCVATVFSRRDACYTFTCPVDEPGERVTRHWVIVVSGLGGNNPRAVIDCVNDFDDPYPVSFDRTTLKPPLPGE